MKASDFINQIKQIAEKEGVALDEAEIVIYVPVPGKGRQGIKEFDFHYDRAGEGHSFTDGSKEVLSISPRV
jgi:hypothetical protein